MSCHGDVDKHFPLVWRACRSFARERRESHPDDSDAFGEGLIHLMRALESYDETQGTKLETWIYNCVSLGLKSWRKLRAVKPNANIEFV